VTRGLHDGAIATQVPYVRLDDLIEAFHLALGVFLNVDVERAELDVLAGLGTRWMGGVCEVEKRGGDVEPAVSRLEDHGLTTETDQQPTIASSPLWTVSARRPRTDLASES